jgi:hypothetical protein
MLSLTAVSTLQESIFRFTFVESYFWAAMVTCNLLCDMNFNAALVTCKLQCAFCIMHFCSAAIVLCSLHCEIYFIYYFSA